MINNILLTPDIGLMFWTVLTFLVLLFLLKKFAWKPIANAVENRSQQISESLEAAEKARKEMENLQAENDKILQEAKKEREKLLKEAKDKKEAIIHEAKSEAREESDKIIAKARKDIAEEKEKAFKELKKDVVHLSVEVAEKIIRKEITSESSQNEVISSYLEEAKLN